MQISNKQLQEIIRLRALIEVDNLEMMVGRISPEQIAQIKAHILETDRKLENGTLTVRNHWENNIAFHKMLYSMSNNQFGASLLDRCLKAETMAYSMYCLYTVEQNDLLDSKGHWAIVNCMEQSDREGAAAALRKDLESISLAL